ncbi:MAG TPA: imidazole glycerol phosphate synthase subunit HisH [Acidimicrobiia bacterium]|nr:imidazole glycerol phosphate synthase subunit HisH [Acidimicrobiia bacterium]
MTRPSIAVVDHGAGNLVSIARGLERAGAEARIATVPGQLAGADGVVLPGVGATATVMAGIRSGGFERPLQRLQVPLFGICVGMQVLFDLSHEDDTTGLGLIAGSVEPLLDPPTTPHIGWNQLEVAEDPLFDGVGEHPEVYFVHSFAPVPADPSVVIARSTHGSPFVAAVRRGPIVGTQFHPERSGPTGLTILRNFVEAAMDRAA